MNLIFIWTVVLCATYNFLCPNRLWYTYVFPLSIQIKLFWLQNVRLKEKREGKEKKEGKMKQMIRLAHLHIHSLRLTRAEARLPAYLSITPCTRQHYPCIIHALVEIRLRNKEKLPLIVLRWIMVETSVPKWTNQWSCMFGKHKYHSLY